MRKIVSTLLLVLFLAGCATPSRTRPELITPSTTGIYHEVARGQTLWDISKMYDVDLKRIINANRLPDASNLEVGQLIFIPNVREKITRESYKRGKSLETFMWPVKGRVVSHFGSTKNMVPNKGIDIEARQGENVLASRSGKVTFCSDYLKGYGNTIIIDHLDGFQTVYAHNDKTLVDIDQEVKQGSVIARAGKTGRVDKPTLHFEIRKDQKAQNPFYYLP